MNNFNYLLCPVSFSFSLAFYVALGMGLVTTSVFAAKETEFDPGFCVRYRGRMLLILVALVMVIRSLRGSIMLTSILIANGKGKLI